jgi:mannosyltransferase
MALPKSMRYLAGATIVVLVFLFVQILKAPAGEVVVPSKIPLSKEGEWDHDPQSDRMRLPCCCEQLRS